METQLGPLGFTFPCTLVLRASIFDGVGYCSSHFLSILISLGNPIHSFSWAANEGHGAEVIVIHIHAEWMFSATILI